MLNETVSMSDYSSQGKVFYVKEYAVSNAKLSSPEVVYNEMKEIEKADQESLWVIGVNVKNMIVSKDLVSLGGVSSTSVDPKIVFRRLIMHNASSFFMVIV